MQDLVVLLGAEVPSGRAIAKKLRTEQYACKLMDSGTTADCIKKLSPSGIIIAGEMTEGATPPDVGLLAMGIPVLALGSAAQALLTCLGSEQQTPPVVDRVLPVYYKNAKIFDEVQSGERWIANAGYYTVPAPYEVIADSEGLPLAFSNLALNLYLMQFQIERNDPDGATILRSFAADICGCTPWWTTENIANAAQAEIERAVGGDMAVCAMSGGLDSTVAAILAKQAVGDRLHCVQVDTGLMRAGEVEETQRYLLEELSLNFHRIDASQAVLAALDGISDMQQKRLVVEKEIDGVLRGLKPPEGRRFVYVMGTNYVDTLSCEEAAAQNETAQEIAPLRELFKSEIRMLGRYLGIADAVLNRQPFPGAGLAARMRGGVTQERLQVLRGADAIFTDEILQAGLDRRIDRFFTMLDDPEGETVVILRAVQGSEPSMNAARLPYDLLERCARRICAALPAGGRVMFDLTPGMAEWPMEA